jgi:opacity protein-like surface antigen
MKHASYSLTLGVALLAAGVVSSHAADWAVGSGGAFGSVKDYRNAAVPVPAPSPMPTANKDWYIRGDFGYNFATNADIGTTGAVLSSQSGQDLDGFLFGSVGFGRYITPNMRAELSLDYRPKRTVNNSRRNSSFTTTRPGSVPGTTDVMTFNRLELDDSTSSDQNVFASLYYDFAQSGRFSPYIGAGLGVDQRRFKRTSSQGNACTSAVNFDNATGNPTGNSVTCTDYSFNDDKDSYAYGIAASLMLGASYQLAPGVLLDSYKLIWQGAEVAQTTSVFGTTSTIRLSDKFEHEWRTGIRLDLN